MIHTSDDCVSLSMFFVSFRESGNIRALVGLLWVTSVLIDGDWYVCCQSDQSEQQAQLPCKDKNNLTAEERTIIAELKNHSKVSAFLL